jgi:hypothetical protein
MHHVLGKQHGTLAFITALGSTVLKIASSAPYNELDACSWFVLLLAASQPAGLKSDLGSPESVNRRLSCSRNKESHDVHETH